MFACETVREKASTAFPWLLHNGLQQRSRLQRKKRFVWERHPSTTVSALGGDGAGMSGADKCDAAIANLASGLASNVSAKQKDVVDKAEEWAFREEAEAGRYWMLARALPAMVRFLTTPTATPQHQFMCGQLLSIMNQSEISEAEDFKEEMAECGMLEVLQACLFNEELAVDDRENAAGTLLNFCSVSQERQEKDKRCVAQLYKLCFLDLVVAVRYGEDMASAVRLACARVITQMLNSGETATEWSILKWARLRRPNPHPDPDPKV